MTAFLTSTEGSTEDELMYDTKILLEIAVDEDDKREEGERARNCKAATGRREVTPPGGPKADARRRGEEKGEERRGMETLRMFLKGSVVR